jgi:hypothetical protein
VLSLPVLTVVVYGIALAYEWGIFDAFGAPHELVKVEIGQLALPAFLCVLVALGVASILYMAVLCLHSRNHLVWRSCSCSRLGVLWVPSGASGGWCCSAW